MDVQSPLYDTIGIDYDATRKPDPFITSRLADLLGLEPSDICLDIACGTGNYTAALAGIGGAWHGTDLSETMIDRARQKSVEIGWHIGDAADLPFGPDSFDKGLCTLALHHFPDLAAVFREAHRVLRDRFVMFTTYPEQTGAYWLREYFPAAIARSVEQLPARESVLDGLRQAGFSVIAEEPYCVRPDLQDLFLYAGKHRPALYLNPKIRAGISTFASLAAPGEVLSGCARLEEDLRSGRIAEVIAGHEHEGGDYVFVVAEK